MKDDFDGLVPPDDLARALRQARSHRAVDRRRALSELSGWKGPELERALLEALSDRSFFVRRIATKALIAADDTRPVEPLLSRLRMSPAGTRLASDSSEPTLSEIVEFGLEKLKSIDPVPRLAEYLRHPSPRMRLVAAGSLGNTADPAAVAPLIQSLDDPARGVRSAAAEALRKFGAPAEATPALVRLLDDPKRLVRREAARALATSKTGLEALTKRAGSGPRRGRRAARYGLRHAS